jgi:cell volume regulation protein A
LSPRHSSVINLESALTDVLCVVATGALISYLVVSAGDANPALELIRSFGIGIGYGLMAGFCSLLVLRRLGQSSHAYPLILGFLFALYVLIDESGGSAAFGILTAAVIVGNSRDLSPVIGLARGYRLTRMVEKTHDQIAFFVKSFFFVFIGAMLAPPASLIFAGAFLGLLLLAARIPAVILATLGSDVSRPARGLMCVSLPRGMAAGVLAMMPAQAGIADMRELPVVVFSCVFTTILIFAGGFPVYRSRLTVEDRALVVQEARAEVVVAVTADPSPVMNEVVREPPASTPLAGPESPTEPV